MPKGQKSKKEKKGEPRHIQKEEGKVKRKGNTGTNSISEDEDDTEQRREIVLSDAYARGPFTVFMKHMNQDKKSKSINVVKVGHILTKCNVKYSHVEKYTWSTWKVNFMIKDLLRKSKMNGQLINLIWIPGHSGITGNELADSRTKTAIQQGKDTEIGVPFREFKNLWKDELYNLTNWRARIWT